MIARFALIFSLALSAVSFADLAFFSRQALAQELTQIVLLINLQYDTRAEGSENDRILHELRAQLRQDTSNQTIRTISASTPGGLQQELDSALSPTEEISRLYLVGGASSSLPDFNPTNESIHLQKVPTVTVYSTHGNLDIRGLPENVPLESNQELFRRMNRFAFSVLRGIRGRFSSHAEIFLPAGFRIDERIPQAGAKIAALKFLLGIQSGEFHSLPANHIVRIEPMALQAPFAPRPTSSSSEDAPAQLPKTREQVLAWLRQERLEGTREALRTLRSDRALIYAEGTSADVRDLMTHEMELENALVETSDQLGALYDSVHVITPGELRNAMSPYAERFKGALDDWHLAEKKLEASKWQDTSERELAALETQKQTALHEMVTVMDLVEIQGLKVNINQHPLLKRQVKKTKSYDGRSRKKYAPSRLGKVAWRTTTALGAAAILAMLWHNVDLPGAATLLETLTAEAKNGAEAVGISWFVNSLPGIREVPNAAAEGFLRWRIGRGLPLEATLAFFAELENQGIDPAFFPEELRTTAACERHLSRVGR